MTVGELKAILEVLDQSLPVILSKDSEGNSYSPLAGWNADYLYEPNNSWSGDLYPESGSLAATDEDPTDVRVVSPSSIKVLTLWPTN